MDLVLEVRLGSKHESLESDIVTVLIGRLVSEGR